MAIRARLTLGTVIFLGIFFVFSLGGWTGQVGRQQTRVNGRLEATRSQPNRAYRQGRK